MTFRLTILISLLISLPLAAAELVIPNTFTANTPAVAEEVNENFTAVQSSVNANNASINSVANELDAVEVRVSDNENSLDSLDARLMIMEDSTTRSLSFSAGAFSFGSPGPVVLQEYGLQFEFYSEGSSISLPARRESRLFLNKPADYAGGDVKVRLTMIGGKDAANGKRFNLAVRAGSFNPGESISNPTPLGPLGTTTFAGICSGDGCVAQLEVGIAASLLTDELWIVTVTRRGLAGLDDFDELYLASLTLDYQAF